jgi:hypothetical protein
MCELKGGMLIYGCGGTLSHILKHFSYISELLHALKCKGAKSSWGPSQQEAFEKLKPG